MTKRIKLFVSILTLVALLLCSCNGGAEGGTPDTSDGGDTKDSTSKEDLTYPLSKANMFDFVLFDGDGDGERDEVLKITLLDMFGGAGQYLVEVFVEHEDSWGYKKIFDSMEYMELHENMDVVCAPSSDGKAILDHEGSGYHGEYTVGEEEYPYLFDEDGNAQGFYLRIDSFYDAEAEDTDGDGCEEIILRQYTSLGWHANYIGDCVTVFRLNGNSFELSNLGFQFK